MSLGLQATKRRMQSVNTTKKITNAMYLVSTAKFKTWKNKLDNSSIYADELVKLFSQLSSSISKEDFEAYFHKDKKANKNVYIVITSSLGMCGGYNYNIFKLLKGKINPEDEIIVIGSKGVSFFENNGFKVNDSYFDLFTGFKYENVKNLATYVLSLVRMNKVDEVRLFYTEFVNSITFEPHEETIYPLSIKEGKKDNELSFKELNCLIEPSPREVLEYLVPLYFESVLYGRLVESEVSEQACRRNAMESATDNASEIISKLQLDYNKARQASITQEITEIVAGANAQN